MEGLARTLPPSMWEMFAPVFDGAKKKEQGFTVRMLGRAGSGKTALMSALIHGVPAPLDGDGSKFDSSFIFKRPEDDSTTTFLRELNCCLTREELHERLVVLNAKADDEGLSGVERREL
jgi:ABC-type lipoprotein export system ATPase subunit